MSILERDSKIEKINAYRKLLDVTLKSVTKSEEVQKEIQEEFKSFVESKLNELMGKGSSEEDSENKLTDDEIYVLKALVAKASLPAKKQDVTQPIKSSGTTVKSGNNPPPAYQPKNLQPALGNRKMEREQKGNANQDVLTRLDELDKKYENEW